MPDFFDILSLRFSAMLPQVVAGLVVAGAFWLLARFAGAFIMSFQSRVAKDHKDLIDLLADVVGWGLFAIGAVAGLGTAGVNVTALVTGLGLTGFAVGFAMKDILSNMIAGVLIMLMRPYGRGDRVRIDKYQGTVTSVDLRYTTLLAPGATVLIPNAMAYTEVVVVLSEEAAEPDAPTSGAPAITTTPATGTAPAPAPTPAAGTAPAISVKAAARPTGRE